jgi:hypothetical protein
VLNRLAEHATIITTDNRFGETPLAVLGGTTRPVGKLDRRRQLVVEERRDTAPEALAVHVAVAGRMDQPEPARAQVWNAATGEPVTLPLKHGHPVKAAAFSPDGTRVVTASHVDDDDDAVQLWNAKTGEPLPSPLEKRGRVLDIAFLPDGARAVTASADDTVRVWDVVRGELLAPPIAHESIVVSAAFSANGARIVTWSVDRTVRVWDASTGKPLMLSLDHRSQGSFAAFSFSPDGSRIVTASQEEPVRIWDATIGRALPIVIPHSSSRAKLPRICRRFVLVVGGRECARTIIGDPQPMTEAGESQRTREPLMSGPSVNGERDQSAHHSQGLDASVAIARCYGNPVNDPGNKRIRIDQPQARPRLMMRHVRSVRDRRSAVSVD